MRVRALVKLGSRLPRPSWPMLLRPHAYTFAVCVSRKVWYAPQWTERTRSRSSAAPLSCAWRVGGVGWAGTRGLGWTGEGDGGLVRLLASWL